MTKVRHTMTPDEEAHWSPSAAASHGAASTRSLLERLEAAQEPQEPRPPTPMQLRIEAGRQERLAARQRRQQERDDLAAAKRTARAQAESRARVEGRQAAARQAKTSAELQELETARQRGLQALLDEAIDELWQRHPGWTRKQAERTLRSRLRA